MNNESPRSSTYAENEIDLLALLDGLWARKWLIVGVTAIATALGVLATFLVAPTYRADVQVRPPDLSDLILINQSGMFKLSVEQAFQRGIHELESQRSRRMAFEAIRQDGLHAGKLENWDWRQFARGISLNLPAPATGVSTRDYVTASYQSGDPELAATAINKLVEVANTNAADTIIGELRYSLETRAELLREQIRQAIDLASLENNYRITQLEEANRLRALQLQDLLASLRAKNKQLRQDRIALLEEAFRIASDLGIEEPEALMQVGIGDGGKDGRLAGLAYIAGDGDPEYLRGTRMLGAEIAALKARKSDDFSSREIRDVEQELALLEHNREAEILEAREDNTAFVEGVSDLREELRLLRAYLDQDYSALRVMRLEEPADPPKYPMNSGKLRIVAIALVAGGTLGVLLALLANATAPMRRSLKASSGTDT